MWEINQAPACSRINLYKERFESVNRTGEWRVRTLFVDLQDPRQVHAPQLSYPALNIDLWLGLGLGAD